MYSQYTASIDFQKIDDFMLFCISRTDPFSQGGRHKRIKSWVLCSSHSVCGMLIETNSAVSLIDKVMKFSKEVTAELIMIYGKRNYFCNEFSISP